GRMVIVVLLLYLVRAAGFSAGAIGLVFAVGAVGFLVGAAVADRVIDRIGVGQTIVMGGSVAAVALLLMVAPPASLSGPFAAVGMFVYGLGALCFTVGNATLRQLLSPPELLGRVTSSMRILVWIAQPVAGVMAGWLGWRIGLRPTMWVGALGALVA